MRVMKIAALCLLAVPLAACPGPDALNQCGGAETRRLGYRATIAAADLYVASGRPHSDAVELGRQAAVTALTILDARCPRPDG